MMAAGTAAEAGARGLVLDPNRRLGRKLRITGKGRCNVTNACAVRDFLQYVPSNPKFLYSALNAFSPETAISFFEGLGVPLKTERGRRVFPVSDNANDIADALENWLQSHSVERRRARADRILKEDGAVSGVRLGEEVISCRAAILCTGGASYPLTGSDGRGYSMARELGHAVTDPEPSLVPLESDDPYCAEMAGFSPRNVVLSVFEDEKCVFQEHGEMLFAHFGVTGPLVLSASAHMRRFGQCRYSLSIDFKPALSREKLDERILRDFENNKNRNIANVLPELLPRTMIPVVLRMTRIESDRKVHSVTKAQREALVACLKAFPVSVKGTRPIAEAIVTRGGVDVRQVDPRTMGSRIISGLFFAGEVLDVDAYTGGYNLQIACYHNEHTLPDNHCQSVER